MKTTTLGRIFGFGVILLAVAMPASADTDGKLFPGALCQPQSQADAIVRSLGLMVNESSSGSQVWTCPIVRDAVDDDAIIFARMTVIDRNNDADTEGGLLGCSLVSSTSTGTGHDLANQNTAGQGGPGTVTLDFVPAVKTEVAGAASGMYFFQCVIPGTDNNGETSGVVSYEIHERND
jgi:hypothetical protein